MNKENRTATERVTDAEIALTHLQQDYESLNEVVLEQQKRIEQLEAHIQRLETKIESNSDPEVRDAEAERPPHY